ncbi:GNAT family N-acetyltransferase [Leucothrix arctica]|uniref:GNAT family N-acetyltransferase n=1 Tax=Leucothrix arctica TaxID=1481894 RepID=A0A317CGC4_9GAMM|nr:GNAT family N-acetyltransferase [Leucothrix arctica]PWQ97578.1 GNAT family N-acetyltransferase [Leucothrix arctica]
MFQIRLVTFEGEDEQSIRAIRESVFVNEQGISADIDFDGLDVKAMHALAYLNDIVVGIGRMLDDGHIGRIAILKAYRGQKVGSKIVLSLIDDATKKGYSRVYLGSQKHANGFYQRLGFTAYGEEFMDAGIVHISMEKALV